MSEPSELLPCPFCGGAASDSGVVHYGHREKQDQNAWWADGSPVEDAYFCNCKSCGANNRGIVGGFQTQENAIEAWNRRAKRAKPKQNEPSELIQEIENVRGMIQPALLQIEVDLIRGSLREIAEKLSARQPESAEPCNGCSIGKGSPECIHCGPPAWERYSPWRARAAIAQSDKGTS